MKLNFKSISAIAMSTVMFGATLGFAAAANYPAPFVQGSNANVALVVGTGSGVSALDSVEAGFIKDDLNSRLPGGVVIGGESYLMEKSSTKWHLGNGLLDVVSATIDDDELPNLLAEGQYTDDDNDEFDYTQKLSMANLSVTMFEDNDYNDDDPSIAMKIASGSHVLNYTLDFTDTPLWTDLETTDLPLLGNEYYVLDSNAPTNTSLTLLDSAADTVLSEGETTTLTAGGNSYEVSISFIGTSEVKLVVNGETTDSLSEQETQKLSDGSYIGIKDISVQDYAGGTKQVEFSIGAGKLVLTHGQDVELNEESIDDLKAWFTTSSGELNEIVIQWNAEDDLFVGPDRSEVMPGFGDIQISFTGMTFPAEEMIHIDAGSDTYVLLNDFPLQDGMVDIPIAYGNSTHYLNTGKDAEEVLHTTNNTVFTVNDTEFFIASWSDGNDAESYYMRVNAFKEENSGSINKTTFQYYSNGAWVDAASDRQNADTVDLGNVELTVGAINADAETVVVTGGNSVEFDVVYSAEGAKVYLPFLANADNNDVHALNDTFVAGNADQATLTVTLSEEDKNENLGAGSNVTATLGFNSATTPEVSIEDAAGESSSRVEIGDSDVFRSFVYSALATEIREDESSDQEMVTFVYHGDESSASVYVSEAGASSGGVDQLGDVVLDDTEYSGLSDSTNAIIVGGSCINSAAASVLGVSPGTCGSAFTDATGINSGEALIRSFSRSGNAIALVVAGYDVSDTQKASTYLQTQTVDTDAGMAYRVTSATSAETLAI